MATRLESLPSTTPVVGSSSPSDQQSSKPFFSSTVAPSLLQRVTSKPHSLALSTPIKNSTYLAAAIRDNPALSELGSILIQNFSVSHKTPAEIQELALLAGCKHPALIQSTLSTLSSAIQEHPFIHTEFFSGLATALSIADPAALSSDDLVKILRLLTDKLSSLHVDPNSESTLKTELHTIAADVLDVSRQDVFEPLYDQQGAFTGHKD